MSKHTLSERDICTKFIALPLGQARGEATDQFISNVELSARAFDSSTRGII